MTDNPSDGDVHVMPIEDVKPHMESEACWCRPWLCNEEDVEMRNAKRCYVHKREMDNPQ